MNTINKIEIYYIVAFTVSGIFDTHKKVLLLTINIGCADGIVGSVFLSNHFLALRRNKGKRVTLNRS